MVASDGTAVYLMYQGQATLVVNRIGSVRMLAVPREATEPAIDDQATTVVYTAGGQVMLLDLAS
jgi:hypothetical protein